MSYPMWGILAARIAINRCCLPLHQDAVNYAHQQWLFEKLHLMGTAILDTKLHIPKLRDDALIRHPLLNQLDALLEPGRKLALVAAPAGFGKTSLVVTWLQRLSTWKIGWLSVDREHNDPSRLLSYLVSIFARNYRSELVEISKALDSGATADYLLPELINVLSVVRMPTIVVFDDYHEISDQRVHERMRYFVENLPDTMRLILTSRVDPPLPLGRMRARGQLVEIRADHLRFTTAETADFLAQVMNLSISPEITSVLEDRTEGWAAGLQLAALSLHNIPDPGERVKFVQAFAGSHRHVVDYLAEEVLHRQSPEVLEFLLKTSILDRFCPALCACIIGNTDSRTMLDYLDRANLFLIPLDSEHHWYRYHHLFADLLRLRLRHDRPSDIRDLHIRAAGWFEAEGLIHEAVSHSLSGEDFHRAARLIMEHSSKMLFRGEIETVHQWLSVLPVEVILAHPRLCLDRARLLLLQHRTSSVDALLDAAEQHLQAIADPDESQKLLMGNVVALRAYPAHERSDFEASIAYSRQALDYFPEDKFAERGACLLYLAHSLHFGGWTREAVPNFLDAMTLLQKAQNTFSTMMCMGQLATVYELLGNLYQARSILDDAFTWANIYGVQQLSPTAVPHARLANILREWNALDDAEAHLKTALELSHGGRPLVAVRVWVLMARVLMAGEDFTGAESAMAQAQRIIKGWETDIERSFVAFNQALLFLRQGDLGRVEHWLLQEKLFLPDPAQPLPNYTEQKLLLWARFLIASDTDRSLFDALELLNALDQIAGNAGRMGIVIEVCILQALTYAALKDQAQAMSALSQALRYAAPQAYVRVFLDEGTPLLDLLAQIPRGHPKVDYARHLMNESQSHSSPAIPSGKGLYQTADGFLLETLSERELQVLHLLSQGLSSNEVAERLIIAIETARKHIKNIYGKLDVHNKVEAVRRAQELGLL